MATKDKDINIEIQTMIASKEFDDIDIIQYVKNDCQKYTLSPKTLGMLLEMYLNVSYDENDPLSGFSREVSIEELQNIHHCFATSNGCQWARSDTGYLGNRYIIKRVQVGGRVSSIKLDGLNLNSTRKKRDIRSDIRKKLENEPCRILDVCSQIEIDHKSGKYNELSNQDKDTQKESDFQPLSKAANDAKRTHCKKCIATGKRYDARRLGYKEGFIVGDEDTQVCAGCYWYDPRRFNEKISKDFKK